MAERIDEIVGDKAFEQFDRLLNKLNESRNLFSDNIKAATLLNNSIAGAKSFKDYAKTVEDTEKALNKVQASQEKARLQEIRLAQAREKAFDKYEASLRKAQAEQEKAAANAAKMASPYNQLTAALNKAEKEALDLGAALGATSPEYLQAASNVQKLRKQVDDLEQPLGKFQRNVGNYRSGFNGLGNSINQLTREFPAFAFSVQTGFLALSNNIPIFFDEMKRAKDSIAQLRAEGQKVPGLFATLTKSIFSFGTALSIGVTLLTIYGKEIGQFFTSLFQGKQAMDAFTLRQKAMGESMKNANFSDASKEVLILNQNIQLAKNGLIDSDGVVKQFNETIGKTVGSVKSLSEAEQRLNEIAPDYIKFTFLKAAAEQAASFAAEKAAEIQREKLKTNEEYLSGFEKFLKKVPTLAKNADAFEEGIAKAADKRRTERVNNLTKEQQSFVEVFTQFSKEAAELSAKLNFDFFGGGDKGTGKNSLLELRKQTLIGLKQTNDLIVEDEKRVLSERIAAANKSIQLSKDIASIEKQQAIESGENKKVAEQMFQNDLANIVSEGNKTIAEIKDQDRKRELDELEKLYDQQIQAAKKADKALLDQLALATEQRQALLNEGAQRELLQLAVLYSEGELSAEQYAQKRIEIQRKLNSDLINAEVKNIETLIALQKSAGIDTADNEKKLAELKQRLSKDATDAQIQDLERLRERENQLIEKRKEIAKEFGNFAIAIVQGQFQQSEETLRKESEAIDIKKAKELEAVEQSILSEQDKAAKIAIINAKAQSQQEAIERRQRQLALDRARFEKQAGIARIIVDTASAVVKALPNIPLSILVGALGAAQLATAVATPLPRFEHGGEMKYTGLAEYGHGTELRIDPDGKVSLTSSKPEIGIVKKGTEFISNKNLMQMLSKPDKTHYAGGQQIDWSDVIMTQKQTSKEVVNAVLSLKQQKQRGVGYYNTAKGQAYYQRNN